MAESPPAGWYGDGSAGERWWDGERWTEHRRPGNSAGGAHAAGEAEAIRVPDPEPRDEQKQQATRSSTCPVCARDDQVKRISSLIDGQSSTTSGTAKTSGVSINTRGTIGIESSSTQFNAATVSNLVGRFAPPTRPGSGLGIAVAVWLLLATVVGIVWQQLTGATSSTTSGALQFLVVLACAIPPGLWWKSKQSENQRAQRLWSEGLRRVREGYYCSRDDIAFAAGSNEALDPAAFVANQFGRNY